MQRLTMGGNAQLRALKFDLAIDWPAHVGTLDSSTYLLDTSGKVRSDADMIFYNQPADASGAVKIVHNEAGKTRLSIDLGLIPADVEKIVSCVTIEDAGMTMEAFSGTSASIRIDGNAELVFTPQLDGAREVAMRLAQLYRRDGVWKIRADGQGFHDGLASLARSFGIDVADDEAPPERESLIMPGASAPTTRETAEHHAFDPIPPMANPPDHAGLTA